jgi:thioesterase domain-containing protein
LASHVYSERDVTGYALERERERGAGMMPGERNGEERARAIIADKVGTIWSRILKCPEVDEHGDFYLSEDAHFLAPVLMQGINDEFGLQLTVLNLEEARTIAKLTDLIYFEQTRIDQSTVVPLRNIHGTRPPLFFVHGVGGNVLGFYTLAKCLDEDQPAYAVQAQALLPNREAKLRLEDMAAQYVQDMRAACPNGPYHLLGFSYGGLVAFEIAQQLRAAGLEVGMLGMLDTRQPQWMRGVPMPAPLYRRMLARMRLVYRRTHSRKGRLLYLWRRLGARVQRFSYMYAANKGPGLVTSAVRNVLEINFLAGMSYTVLPYPGKVLLFRAETSDPTQLPLPEDLGWDRYASGGLEVKHLPGDHGGVLYEPGLSALAAELTSRLGKDAERLANDLPYAGFQSPNGVRVNLEF